MVVRRNWLSGCGLGNCSNLGRSATCGDQSMELDDRRTVGVIVLAGC